MSAQKELGIDVAAERANNDDLVQKLENLLNSWSHTRTGVSRNGSSSNGNAGMPSGNEIDVASETDGSFGIQQLKRFSFGNLVDSIIIANRQYSYKDLLFHNLISIGLVTLAIYLYPSHFVFLLLAMIVIMMTLLYIIMCNRSARINTPINKDKLNALRNAAYNLNKKANGEGQ